MPNDESERRPPDDQSPTPTLQCPICDTAAEDVRIIEPDFVRLEPCGHRVRDDRL